MVKIIMHGCNGKMGQVSQELLPLTKTQKLLRE